MLSEDSSWSKHDCVRFVLRGHRLLTSSQREGRFLPDDQFVESFEELLPELREELSKSHKIARLREESAQSFAVCPKCSSRIEITARRLDPRIVCKACSNTFEPGKQSTIRQVRSRLTVPRRIGHFLLIERIGRGGFGEVWKAQDTTLHRTVAIKFALGVDDEDRSRFLREAESAAKLKHPHIVEVFQSGELHDFGETRGTLYLVSRFVEGRSLRAAMVQEPVLTPQRAAKLCLMLTRAVAHAHAHFVIHRDLKPENILLDENSEPHVTDFGLAKQLARDTVMTREGMILGSPAYMSPEQAAGLGHSVGPATDIYSIGAILYELLTGQKTFRGSNLSSVLSQVREEMPPPVRQLNDTVPLDLNTICMKCLQKRPLDRFTVATELADELERFLEGKPIRSRPVGLVTVAIRWSRRKPALAMMIGALAATVLVATSLISLAWASERDAHRVAEHRRQQAVTSLGVAHESLGTAYLRLGAAFKLFPQMEVAYEHFLLQGARQYEQLAAVETDDPDLQLERGRVWLILGDIRQDLGLTGEAKSAYETAGEMFSRTRNHAAPRKGAEVEWANSRGRLAAIAIREQDDETARILNVEAVTQLEQLHRKYPTDRYCEYSLATAEFNLASLLMTMKAADDANQWLRSSADRFAHLTESSPRIDWLTDYVRVLTLLGHQASQAGQHSEAIQRIESGLKRLRQFESQATGDVRYLEARSASHVYLAQAFDYAGRTSEALAEYERSVVDLTELSRLAPSVVRFADELDLRQVDFAQALYDAGQLRRAEQQLRLVETRLSKAAESAPDDPVIQYVSGLCHDSLARVLADQGDNAQADQHARHSVVCFRSLDSLKEPASQSDYSLRLAISLIHQAEIAHKLADDGRAIAGFLEADTLLERLLEAEPDLQIVREVAAFRHRAAGLLHWDLGQQGAARQSFETAINLWNSLVDAERSPRYAANLTGFLIEVPVLELRDGERAEQLARMLVDAAPMNRRHQAILGAVCVTVKKFPEAIQRIETLPEEERRARDWLYLSQAQWLNGQIDQAFRSLQRAESTIASEGSDNRALLRLQTETKALLYKRDAS